MAKKQAKPPRLADMLRAAIEADGRTVYAIGKASGVSYSILHRFMAGERDMTLDTAGALVEVLGLELRKREG